MFGADKVGMLTGDAAVNERAPIICCTAEILANIALRSGRDADVGSVVMDEFHFYADPARGWAWQVPLIELPQALRSMVPTFMNQLIQLIKGTALVSLITLTDMTYRAKELAQVEYNPVGIYSGLLIAYLIICYPVTVLGRSIEQRTSYAESKHREF